MNSQAFKILEFDALRALVARYAQTDPARARLEQLTPISNYEELQSDLTRLQEMIELRPRGTRLSFEGLADPREAISRLKIAGAALEPLAILDLARLCDRALETRALLHEQREICSSLFAIVAPISTDLKKLSDEVGRKILPTGELDDRASPQLASIRRELTKARARITRSLENLMRRSSEAIQEELVTVRNDRFVIPVRADHQSRIKGVAHGSSSSGATVFIEPLETIEGNNELQTLREAEQREIAEILFALSENLRGALPAIELAVQAIAELDFVNAKATFAESFDCVAPIVSEPLVTESLVTEPPPVGSGSNTQLEKNHPLATAGGPNIILEITEGRHPLLQQSLSGSGNSVVPISFKLDDQYSVMIISGANAGGKTVALKTAGLLSLMARCALPVPAKVAHVPFYRSILADIGDQQSLAANLSTFTSHVANIAKMIELCEKPALVLLDEVGTGTDPEEGSALGVAVVDHFKRQAAHVMATTHYSGLKMYAANEPGVLNASVEFDEQTLRPTYRLLVGLAGSSSGLEIARRFGIPNRIIRNASAQVQQSSLEAIEYLRRIKLEAEAAERLRKALEEERAAVAERFASLENEFHKRESARQREFEKQVARAVAEFQQLSRELLSKIEDRAARLRVEREAERRAAELKREAQRAAKNFSAAARLRERDTIQSQGHDNLPSQLRGVRVVRDGQVVADARQVGPSSDTSIDDLESAAKANAAADLPPRAIRKGDRVRLRTLGSIGIVDHTKGNEAEIRVGSLRMREKLSNLDLLDKENYRTASGSERSSSPTIREGSLEQLRRQATTTELHLHAPESDSKSDGELNLIGKTTDQATDLVDKFLDQAFLNGIREVRIIHGHGTGVLRKAVAEVLTAHAHVDRFAPAAQDKGGTGATIVTLKQ